MKGRRQAHHRSDDEEKARGSAARRSPHVAPEAASIHDLQSRAGNQAVSALIGSGGNPAHAHVQLDARRATGAEPANDGPREGHHRMAIPSMKLVVPILSASLPQNRPSRESEKQVELRVIISLDAMDARLADAFASGRSVGSVTISIGQVRVTLEGVYISSLTSEPETVIIGLVADSVEISGGE